MNELVTVGKLETVTKSFTKTIEGQEELAVLIPDIGVDEIISSALFKDTMVLEVEGLVSAGYMIKNVKNEDIAVSRDGTVTIVLGEPEIF